MSTKRIADFIGVDDLSGFTADDLRQGIEDGYYILDPILDNEAPSAEDIAKARETHAEIKRLESRLAEVEAEDKAIADEMTAMREAREARNKAPEEKPETDEAEAEVTDDAEETDTTEADQPEEVTAEETTEPEVEDSVVVAEIDVETGEVTEVEPERELVTASATTATPRTAGRRPVAPKKESPVKDTVLIRAAHDTGVRASGETLESMLDVAKVAQARFAQTRGMQGKMSLGVATFQKPIGDEFQINEGMSDEAQAAVVDFVGSESRLEGGSLVAANAGWCAPLETIYDLCDGGTTEGLWDIPEMRVNRGGVRHIPSLDFSSLYAANTTPGTTAAGWYYTEAQVQADTAKVCIEIPCPAWDEVVLDAAGICVTSSLLTNVAFPEWVKKFTAEAMIAHQVLVQQKLLNDAITNANAVTATDMHSTAGSTLAAIELIVLGLRQQYRWSFGESLEMVFPHWVKGAIRADLSMRNGVNLLSVTDAEIMSWFAVRGVRPQFVYGIDDLPADAVVYPATFTALVYKAGTYVKGTTPVINLSTLYDSSLLSVNKAQQLFFEEGVLMLERCYGGTAVTIPVNNSGASAGQLVEALTAEDLTA